MREWLSRDAWAAAVAKGEIPTAGLRKAFVADVEKAADEANRAIYRFVISTATPDRERDTIAVDGWKLKHYRQNPVVLWAHDYRQPPLGQAVELPKVRDGKLVSGVRFDSDISEFAALIEAMVERGTLRATSVGFAPTKHQLNDERRGYDFLEQELLEWSIVPVPANPEALAEAKSAGLDLGPIRTWAESVLEGEHGPGFWLARTTLEAAWKASAPSVAVWSMPASNLNTDLNNVFRLSTTLTSDATPTVTSTVSTGSITYPAKSDPEMDCPEGHDCPDDAVDDAGRECSRDDECPKRGHRAAWLRQVALIGASVVSEHIVRQTLNRLTGRVD